MTPESVARILGQRWALSREEYYNYRGLLASLNAAGI